jgi:SNF2 family DNA or RNA helicase
MALTDRMPSVVPVVTVKDAGNDFDVNISFDAMGTDVSPVEIQAAVNRGDGYLMRDGETILIDRSAIDSIRSVFSDCATSQNGAERGWFRVKGVYSPYVRSALESLDAVDLDDSAAANWRERSRERTCAGGDAKCEPVSIGRLDGILRPYQKQGVYWMRFLENSGYAGLLADEMGLGKTLQTLAWLSLPRAAAGARRNGRNLPALIVCPTSLVRNWEAEAEKFVPELRTLVISGADRAENFGRIDDADLVITSYALVQRDFEAAYLEREFSAIVLDEAQHIKNRQTKNAQTVKMLRSATRLVLTGTPVENSVADVWSIFDFSMPGYLGFYDDFKAGYEEPIADGGSAAQAATERLKRKLAPFILRRLKKTVAKDLPDKIVKISYCPMSEDAEREYTAALASSRREAGGLIRSKGFAKSKFELLALLMKLRRIASRAKIEPFMEQLTSAVEGGHKILVFSQFVKTLAELKEKLTEAGIPFCYLDGSTKDRLGECNRFNRSADIPVFLISLMAGGTGLNLTGADMVIHYDPWWNPAVEDQATDRAHRIGQKKIVYVMKMIASDTIEEKVLALQRRKQAVIAATVSTTDDAVMQKLTAEDIASLLS